MNGLSESFIVITLSAGLYLLFSSFVMKTFGRRDRVMEIQKEMNEMNKEHREALKSGDKERLARAEKNYSRMMPLLTESMTLQFRPLIVLLPILFIVPPFLRAQYPEFQIKMPIP
ncbi:MAG: EMC3/TMCO1 family protein, partial [Candidatus Micrarchaeota archaeon]